MFRIHNLDELDRLRKLVNRLGDDLKFPVDIFRTDERISAIESGEAHKEVYTYTTEGKRTVFEGAECSQDLRFVYQLAERKGVIV